MRGIFTFVKRHWLKVIVIFGIGAVAAFLFPKVGEIASGVADKVNPDKK